MKLAYWTASILLMLVTNEGSAGPQKGLNTHLSGGAQVGPMEASFSVGFKVKADEEERARAMAQKPIEILERRGELRGMAAERSQGNEALGGRLETVSNGASVLFTVLKTDIDVEIEGDLAEVEIRQQFENPFANPVHATYVFPLNEWAAVNDMHLQVGDEVIRAEIQEKNQAQQTFNLAKEAGQNAALLEQHRPNIFSQNLANLMPGLPIAVTLRYVQTVPRMDSGYELVVPLVVGPRYAPEPTSILDGQKTSRAGKWQMSALPAPNPVSGISAPEHLESKRVAIQVSLRAGMPIREVSSPTHYLSRQMLNAHDQQFRLAEGRTLDNRDFILRYQLAGDATQAGLLTYFDGSQGYFSLMLEPPAEASEAEIFPREMVYVLDCSGSMHGLPIETSKRFIIESLRSLRAYDTFRIVRFSDGATEMSSVPLASTEENIQQGITYVNQLESEGGTEMTRGIRQALAVPTVPGRMRLVVFLTDGYIGNETDVLQLIQQYIGPSRLFALGVGDSVNRYLLNEISEQGRGFTRYMRLDESSELVARELKNRLDAPLLSDVSIDWGDLAAVDIVPAVFSDLFAGNSLRIQGKYAKPGKYRIVVHGQYRGREAQLPLDLDLREVHGRGQAIATIWARAKVADLTTEMLEPVSLRGSQQTDDGIQNSITELGLKYRLITQWTSFVAVSSRIANSAPHLTAQATVPVPPVQGVTAAAYGQGNNLAAGPLHMAAPAFSGHAAPEPSVYGALAMAAIVAALGRRKKKRGQRMSGF